MPINATHQTAVKESLHPNNLHRNGYNFDKLIKVSPQLKLFVQRNLHGVESIDFSNPEAVKVLNSALLKCFYGINYWDIPAGYLCPPVPGRADYIHYMADLLAEENNAIVPTGLQIKVLDIGVGANCIYPIIGNSVYGWQFTGTDIDPVAIGAANKIIKQNGLESGIKTRPQSNRANVFKGAITQSEVFDFTMCNPPFHSSLNEAQSGSVRKTQNLNKGKVEKTVLNFGGKNNELWYPGGEVAFIRNMADQSALFADRVLWFSTLVSKKDSLAAVYRALHKVEAVEVKTISMAQGQKISRIVAWTFFDPAGRADWRKRFWGKV